MSSHFDALETRDPAQREAALMAALPKQVAHAKASARAFAKSLQSVDAFQVNSRAALAKLPGPVSLQALAPSMSQRVRALTIGAWRERCLLLAFVKTS